MLHDLGVGERLDRAGLRHTGVSIRHQGRTQHVDLSDLTGRFLTVYGRAAARRPLAGPPPGPT